jgi:hypothetical protein
MKTYIFMNEHIREPNPVKPVIVAVQEGERRRTANTFELEVGGKVIGAVKFRPTGLRAVSSHRVLAWLELDPEVVVR